MKSFINLLDEANAEIKTISVTELKSIMNQYDIVGQKNVLRVSPTVTRLPVYRRFQV